MPIFVTDRTQADVDEAKALYEKILTDGYSSLTADEQTAWATDLKGMYNASDFQRVTGQMSDIVTLFTTYYGYTPNVTLTTWTTPSSGSSQPSPTKQDYDDFGEAVRTICEAVGKSSSSFANIPYGMNYQTANEIEKYLQDAYNGLNASKNFTFAICGEEIAEADFWR